MKRLLIILLVCCAMLAGCSDDTQEQAIAPTETTEPTHVHEYTETVTPPTCTEKGITTYTCACGDTYTGNEVDATGHSYDAVVTEATCTEGGYTTYTCSVCKDTYKGDEVAATGHKYEAVVTEATCTEGGYTTHTCSCGDTYKDTEVAATGHSYNKSVIAPTCEKNGYSLYTCTCGDTYKDSETAAKGHSYSTQTIAPTTESEGYDLHTCSQCGNSYIDNYKDKLSTETEPPATESTKPEEESYPLRTEKTGLGTRYYRKNVSFTDSRKTWGDPPTVYGYGINSIYVSWHDKEGVLKELYIEPMSGYAVRYRLMDDGTVTQQYDALPDNVDGNFSE